MLILNNNNNLVSEKIYPIFYCNVEGRIISQVKPTKSKRKPKPKEKKFTVKAPIKFDTNGITPISKRLISLREKYSYTKDDQIVYDNVTKIKQLGTTKIRD